jgi:hypothetical protein
MFRSLSKKSEAGLIHTSMSLFLTRSFAVDSKTKSAVIATQNPVPMIPDGRGGLLPEILLMSGLVLPEDRSIKLLDTHNNDSIDHIKGKINNLRVEDGELVGDLDMDEGEIDAVRKVQKGYVDRMSAGYYSDEFEEIEKGKSRTYEWEEEDRSPKTPPEDGTLRTARKDDTEEEDADPKNLRSEDDDEDCDCDPDDEDCHCHDDDRCEEDRDDDDEYRKAKRGAHPLKRTVKRTLRVEGPAVVTTRWRIREGSLVAIPADDDAKIRSEYLNTLKAGASVAQPKVETSRRTMDEKTIETPPVEAPAVDVQAVRDRAIKENNDFRAKVRKQCQAVGHPDFADEIAEAVPTLDFGKACELLVNRMATSQNKPDHVVVGEDEKVKSRNFVSDLVKYRAIREILVNAGPNDKKEVFEREMPKGDFEKYNAWGYREIARMMMESRGESARMLSGNQILQREFLGQRAGGYGDVTPGSLPNIFLDAVNVSLALQYKAAETTFDIVGRKAADFVGMFNVHVQRLSNVNTLPAWPVGEPPKRVKLYDAPSTWVPVNYGANMVIDYGSILADRLDFISTIPASLAWAAKRTINQQFWALISGNQTVQEDTKALFDSSHVNTASNQDDPYNGNSTTYGTSVWNLSKLRSLLRQQRGLDGSLIRLTPSFLVVPTTLETQGDVTVQSPSSPIPNVFMGLQTFKGSLRTLVEPELDASSLTAFYMMAEPIQACAGYAYHEGQSTPLIDSFIYQMDKSYVYQASQASAVGLVDFRTVAKYTGT